MAPAQALHLHFCGIHIAKSNPKFQIITQHYCMSRSDEMHQCLLYDSYERNARLIGVEYIVTDRIYRELPDTEKKYWHPHTYEVLAGGLIAPEHEARGRAGVHEGAFDHLGKDLAHLARPDHPVPMGEPLLMWALTGDGQHDTDVIATRDKHFKVSGAAIREQRCQSIGFEVPKVSLPQSIDQVGRQWTD